MPPEELCEEGGNKMMRGSNGSEGGRGTGGTGALGADKPGDLTPALARVPQCLARTIAKLPSATKHSMGRCWNSSAGHWTTLPC